MVDGHGKRFILKKNSFYGNKTFSKVRDILCESKAGDNYIIRSSLFKCLHFYVCVGRKNIMNVDTCILLKMVLTLIGINKVVKNISF